MKMMKKMTMRKTKRNKMKKKKLTKTKKKKLSKTKKMKLSKTKNKKRTSNLFLHLLNPIFLDYQVLRKTWITKLTSQVLIKTK
jgi:phenylalanyl-tRNA synthetase beta subunit